MYKNVRKCNKVYKTVKKSLKINGSHLIHTIPGENKLCSQLLIPKYNFYLQLFAIICTL